MKRSSGWGDHHVTLAGVTLGGSLHKGRPIKSTSEVDAQVQANHTCASSSCG